MPTWPTGLSIRREGFGKGKRRLISKLNAVLHTVNRFLLNSNSRDCRTASIFPLVCIVPTIYFHHFISLSIPFLRSDCPSMFRVYSSPFFLLPASLLLYLRAIYLSIFFFWLAVRSLLRRCSRLGHCFAISAYSASPGSAKQRANNGPRRDLNRIFFCVTIFYPLFYPLSSPLFSPVPSFCTTSLYPSLLILRLWIRWDTRLLKGYFGGWKSMHSLFSRDRVSYRGGLLLSVCLSLSMYISRFISAFRSPPT